MPPFFRGGGGTFFDTECRERKELSTGGHRKHQSFCKSRRSEQTNLETKGAKIPMNRRGHRSEAGTHFPLKIFAKF